MEWFGLHEIASKFEIEKNTARP